jgi:hypothetical protein
MKYPPNIKRPRRKGARMIASSTVSIRAHDSALLARYRNSSSPD